MERLKLPAFWEEAKKTEVFQKILSDLLKAYELGKDEPPAKLPATLRDIFKQTGSRREFEKEYFQKRNFTVTLALLALVFPEKEEYLSRLRIFLRSVCKEDSWAVPAHCVGEKDERTVVDLFASETACMLAEISLLFKSELGEELTGLIEEEISKRVFEPYRCNTYWWETGWNNWTAVCCGHIGIAMMRIAPELFEEQKARILRSMSLYINGFPEDGNCPEGLTYWHYGFGSWVWFADALYGYSGGKEDLFLNAKAEKIAGYAPKMLLKGGTAVSVADASISGKCDPTLITYLHKKYPKSCGFVTKAQSKYWRGNVSWLPVTRMLFYGLKAEYVSELPQKNYYFGSSGQAVLNSDRYSLFVKAGNNAESHNHNDVGSFILSTEAGQVFCDLGSPTYFGGYFDNDVRYTVLNASSRGHSVPIVDGEGQKFGKEYGGTMTIEEGRIAIDFADAYGAKIKKLTREFRLEDSFITLTDKFVGCKEITERFVTLIKPEIADGGVKIANVILSCKDGAPEIKEVTDEKYYVGNPQTVYCIDYAFTGREEAVFEMKILKP